MTKNKEGPLKYDGRFTDIKADKESDALPDIKAVKGRPVKKLKNSKRMESIEKQRKILESIGKEKPPGQRTADPAPKGSDQPGNSKQPENSEQTLKHSDRRLPHKDVKETTDKKNKGPETDKKGKNRSASKESNESPAKRKKSDRKKQDSKKNGPKSVGQESPETRLVMNRALEKQRDAESYTESDADIQEESKEKLIDDTEDIAGYTVSKTQSIVRKRRMQEEDERSRLSFSQKKKSTDPLSNKGSRFSSKESAFQTGDVAADETDMDVQEKARNNLFARAFRIGRNKAIAGAAVDTVIGGGGAEAAGEAAGAAAASAAGETAGAAGAGTIWIALPIVLIFIVIAVIILYGIVTAMTSMIGAHTQIMDTTSYISDDRTILTNENTYKKKEKDLKNKIKNTEILKPGYDEYKYVLNGEETVKEALINVIKHDPYILTSYLTAKYQDYKEKDVTGDLQAIFNELFELEYEERIEIRYRDVLDEDGDPVLDEEGNTIQEPYEWKVLYTKVKTKDMDEILTQKLSGDQAKTTLYETYKTTKGNRPNLFGGSSLSADDYYHFSYTDDDDDNDHSQEYEEAAAAVSGTDAERMYEVGSMLLGTPYVMGAAHGSGVYSSHPRAVDCSSFVSWVINHSIGDVGDNVTDGLLAKCDAIPVSEARPGDIIFFSGTYKTTYTTSHVGIYIGNGKMMHAGNPVKISDLNTDYWQRHFFTYGRLKEKYRN